MTHNFKIKDKVFDYRYGWMLVKCITEEQIITENSNKDLSINVYYYDVNNLKTLSFTEYTLDGFSQERPIEEPKLGSMGYFYDTEDDYTINYGKLYRINKTFIYKYVSTKGQPFKQFSLTPPNLNY